MFIWSLPCSELFICYWTLLNYYMFSMRYSYSVSFSGEWLLVIVYMFRDQLQELMGGQVGLVRPGGGGSNASAPSLSSQLELHHLTNVHWFIVMAVSTSFIMYYGLAYGWHYYYYVNRRHLVILIFLYSHPFLLSLLQFFFNSCTDIENI